VHTLSDCVCQCGGPSTFIIHTEGPAYVLEDASAGAAAWAVTLRRLATRLYGGSCGGKDNGAKAIAMPVPMLPVV